MSKIDRSKFLKTIKDKYPSLASTLNAQGGGLTFEASVFVQFLQQLINDGEKKKFQEAINLAEEFLLMGNRWLSDSIRNGVCEDLIFEDSKKNARSWALAYLPSALLKERAAWQKFMDDRNAQ